MCHIDRILVLDTETASLTRGVVEVAFYEIDENFNVKDRQRSLINPQCPIEPQAAGVHGITMDDVKDSPTLSEYMPREFLSELVMLIGHNISFDIRFVGQCFKEIEPLCTLKLARLTYPEAPDHKLQTLMYYLGLTRGGNHNALDDVNTSYELLLHIAETHQKNLQELYELSKVPTLVKTMPFGLHKGKSLKSLPPKYVAWLLALDNLDDNLRYSLNQL